MICTQPVAEEEMLASFTLCVSACWGLGRMGEGVPPVVAGLLRNLMRNLNKRESERESSFEPILTHTAPKSRQPQLTVESTYYLRPQPEED